jgi:DNA processing protein
MARQPGEVDDATLRLLTAQGVGPATVRRLRGRFGSPDAAVAATVAQIARVCGVTRASAEAIRRAVDATDPDAERRAMHASAARLILFGDGDYPVLLGAVPGSPEALWVRGDPDALGPLAVAVVGARRSTPYGNEQASRLAALLAQSGLSIVSGGAAGIDAAAHRGALRVAGRTVAVMGCGLGLCYPPRHVRLFERIVDGGGALVSEHPMGAPPIAGHFPRRNRIISGLGLGVLVVEAALRSGALITARLAAEEHGREVMAVPGRIDSPASAGCHALIRDGAGLVVDHADVLRQIDAVGRQTRVLLEAGGVPDAAVGSTLFDETVTDGQRALVSALEAADGPVPADLLAARTGRPLGEMMADLTLLEVRGRVRRGRGGFALRGS